MDAIQNNEELKEKFDEISSKEPAEQKDYTDEVIALARESGIMLSEVDFEFDEELSDEELEDVAGGRGMSKLEEATGLIRKMLEADKRMEERRKKIEATEDQN